MTITSSSHPDAIIDELRHVQELFRRKGFIVINVTDKTIEVNADENIRRKS